MRQLGGICIKGLMVGGGRTAVRPYGVAGLVVL